MNTDTRPYLIVIIVLFILVLVFVAVIIWLYTNYIPPSRCQLAPGRYYLNNNWNYSGIRSSQQMSDLNAAQLYCNSQGTNCPAFLWNPQQLRMIIVHSVGPNIQNSNNEPAGDLYIKTN